METSVKVLININKGFCRTDANKYGLEVIILIFTTFQGRG
jgi:hypothetical protein